MASGCAGLPPVGSGFDRRGSQPAAVALADRLIARAGGVAAWSQVRELGWLEGTVVDGRLVAVQELVWDRVRHRIRRVQLADDDSVTVAMGSAGSGRGAAYRVLDTGCTARFVGPVLARVLADARRTVRREAFLLTLPFSLESRGVRLALGRPRVLPTVLVDDDKPPAYDVLRVEGSAVGDFDLVVARQSGRPVLLERRRPDGVLEGTYLRRFAPVGRVRLATRRDDAGSTAGAPLAHFTVPAAWRSRIALSPWPVPARGTVTVVSDIGAYPDVDDGQFVPAVGGPATL